MSEPKTKKRASRRDFLKTTAASGAAMVGGLSLVRGAHAAGTEEIRVGMIGCGGRCSGAAASALRTGKDVKLAGMADVFQKRMEAKRKLFQTQFPEQFTATDATCTYGLDGYKTVIEASDAVLVACASKYHSFYAEEALKAGKHVFIEKPHAIDPAGCIRLRRACKLAQEKPTEALRYAAEAKTVYPQEPHAYHVHGFSSLMAKQYQPAIADFSHYESVLPGNPSNVFLLGLSYEGTNNMEKAAEMYMQYLKQVRTGKQAEYAQQRLIEWGYVKPAAQQ